MVALIHRSRKRVRGRDLRTQSKSRQLFSGITIRNDRKSLEGRVPASLDGHSPEGVPGRARRVRERLEKASFTNEMQLITVCLVFLDSCGCDPTPRIHLRVEHPGWRSIASHPPQVKRETTGQNRKGEANVKTAPPGSTLARWLNHRMFGSVSQKSKATKVRRCPAWPNHHTRGFVSQVWLPGS